MQTSHNAPERFLVAMTMTERGDGFFPISHARLRTDDRSEAEREFFRLAELHNERTDNVGARRTVMLLDKLAPRPLAAHVNDAAPHVNDAADNV